MAKGKLKKKPIGNGRNRKGQFAKGNNLSVGHVNPIRSKRQQLADALIATVTKSDIVEIVKKLIEEAKAGDLPATHELLNRCVGRALQQIDVDAKVGVSESLQEFIEWLKNRDYE